MPLHRHRIKPSLLARHRAGAVRLFRGGDSPALEKLRHEPARREAVILSTCNRVEIYAVTELAGTGGGAARCGNFCWTTTNGREPLRDEIYCHADARGLEHLFKVACGLDSMVLGETEILGQLKKAYERPCGTSTPAAV